MTRVMVIGSSHVGALKRGSKSFAASRPDVALDFFALRGPVFLAGKVDDNAVFQPAYGRKFASDRDLSRRTNGAEVAALGDYDNHLFVGQRFGFGAVLSLLDDNDVLEGARSGRAGLIPRGLVSETMEASAGPLIDGFANSVAALGRGVTVLQAPYPAQSYRTLAGQMQAARQHASFWDHPEAARIFHDWLVFCATRLAKHGHSLLRQPDHTVAGPYATGADWARGAADFDSGLLGRTDHRHMNEDYGRAVLDAFAQQTLTAGQPALKSQVRG